MMNTSYQQGKVVEVGRFNSVIYIYTQLTIVAMATKFEENDL